MTQYLGPRDPKKTHPRELEIGLPGEHLADPDLVGRAIEDLNRIHLDCALDYCLRVGDYILDSFFDGETGQFDRRAKRHRTFRSLAESGMLTFSTSYLWTSVAVACQYRELPPSVAEKLPLSHHRLLLSVGDLPTKRRLAGRAFDDALSKRQLQDVVRRYRKRAGHAGPGRPAHPPILKHLVKLDDALQALLEMPEPELEVDPKFRDKILDLTERAREDLQLLDVKLERVREATEEAHYPE